MSTLREFPTSYLFPSLLPAAHLSLRLFCDFAKRTIGRALPVRAIRPGPRLVAFVSFDDWEPPSCWFQYVSPAGGVLTWFPEALLPSHCPLWIGAGLMGGGGGLGIVCLHLLFLSGACVSLPGHTMSKLSVCLSVFGPANLCLPVLSSGPLPERIFTPTSSYERRRRRSRELHTNRGYRTRTASCSSTQIAHSWRGATAWSLNEIGRAHV